MADEMFERVDTTKAFGSALDLLGDDTDSSTTSDSDDENLSSALEGLVDDDEEEVPTDSESSEDEEGLDDEDGSDDSEEEDVSKPLDRSWKRLAQEKKKLDKERKELSDLKKEMKLQDDSRWSSDPVVALKDTIKRAYNISDESDLRPILDDIYTELMYEVLDIEDMPEDLKLKKKYKELERELKRQQAENEQKKMELEQRQLEEQRSKQVKEFKGQISQSLGKATNLKKLAPMFDETPEDVVYDVMFARYQQGVEMTIEDAVAECESFFKERGKALRKILLEEESKERDVEAPAPRRNVKKRRKATKAAPTRAAGTSIDDVKSSAFSRALAKL